MKKLQWHKQETSSSCLPACLRMVLDYYGISRSEKVLRRMCKTKPLGTHPINVVQAAKSLDLESYLITADLAVLIDLLQENIPPIITILDEQAEIIISHALVIQNINRKCVEVLDPEKGQHRLLHGQFDRLWSAAGRLAIIVKKRKA